MEATATDAGILLQACHLLRHAGRATCSDMLEKIATGAQREAGLDIADFLLMEDTPQMILQQMTARNPALQSLINVFGLELVDARRVE